MITNSEPQISIYCESHCQESVSNKEIQRPKVLFIGKAGVGKTKLFNLFKAENIETLGFKDDKFPELNVKGEQCGYTVVDTPYFELNSSIDERENTITKFQNYLYNKSTELFVFSIVVNFERTDLMKAKVLEVFKYIKKFSQSILLIVTEWEKSENKETDKVNLQESFKYITDHILFVPFDVQCDILINELGQIIKSIPKVNAELKDTIFEILQEDESTLAFLQQMVQQLEKKQWETRETQDQTNLLTNKYMIAITLGTLLMGYAIKYKFK